LIIVWLFLFDISLCWNLCLWKTLKFTYQTCFDILTGWVFMRNYFILNKIRLITLCYIHTITKIISWFSPIRLILRKIICYISRLNPNFWNDFRIIHCIILPIKKFELVFEIFLCRNRSCSGCYCLTISLILKHSWFIHANIQITFIGIILFLREGIVLFLNNTW